MAYAQSIDDFFSRPSPFSEQLATLRQIMLDAGLQETLKWGIPVYVGHQKNIAGIAAFKSYAGIWFYQGALLSDPGGVLVNAQEGKTQAMRQWRFQEGDHLDRSLVRSYLEEALEHAREGREVVAKKSRPLVIPEELRQALASDPDVARQFDQLSLSCRREYAEYIGEAKREETRLRRLEKAIPMILAQKGLQDQYR
ncbi:MAG: YdeI/OmpD-associated family protein [Lewinellaceae bacterium]|nr:YdeI/OmpD-associated family protein [Saprospiraceae bacterium]MCB9312369.1 YdeI/OmpD-associated family protein [Lewinellaceae bacterium]